MQEKTFREVIADIKEGETWESDFKRIKCTKDGIEVEIILGLDNNILGFANDVKYKLQRQEYTFEEAFKAYEEGKEIESLQSGVLLKKNDNGEILYKYNNSRQQHFEEFKNDLCIFSVDDIRGKWYINN